MDTESEEEGEDKHDGAGLLVNPRVVVLLQSCKNESAGAVSEGENGEVDVDVTGEVVLVELDEEVAEDAHHPEGDLDD